jgi:hypothetical protein
VRWSDSHIQLRAVETCDLAEHRSMRLKGEAGYARNGGWVNHEMAHTRYFRDFTGRGLRSLFRLERRDGGEQGGFGFWNERHDA